MRKVQVQPTCLISLPCGGFRERSIRQSFASTLTTICLRRAMRPTLVNNLRVLVPVKRTIDYVRQ